MATIKKILESNITYYIIVPYSILFFEWIKKWIDESIGTNNLRPYKKTKALFYEISLFYFKTTLNIAMMLIFIFSIFSAYEMFVICILCFYFIGPHIKKVIYIFTHSELKLEFWTYKNFKITLLVIQTVITFFPFFLPLDDHIIILIWGSSLFLWFAIMYHISDKVITYNNKYADIYINDNTTIKQIKIDDIKRTGIWLNIKTCDSNKTHKVRINKIDRIEYYGEPLIIVILRSFPFKK